MFPIGAEPNNSIRGWCFSADEISTALSRGDMLNPSIDLSNACNLNCAYCFIEEKNSVRKVRKPNELSIEETLKIIADFSACGARTVNIVGAGEPTIDPHFEQVIKSISKAGMTTVLFTNGIRIAQQPELLTLLYENDVSIVLKYNSTSSKTQDLVAGRRGYTEKRDEALNRMIAVGFNVGCPTRLGLDIMVFRGNLHELSSIHLQCREQNIFPVAGEFIPTGRTEDGNFIGFDALSGFSENERSEIESLLHPVTLGQRTSLVNLIAAIDKKLGIDRPKTFAYFGGSICTQRLGVYVDIEGNIWPCVARKQHNNSDGLLGNVRNGDKPSLVWRDTPYLKNVRKTFSGGCPFKAPLNLPSQTSHPWI